MGDAIRTLYTIIMMEPTVLSAWSIALAAAIGAAVGGLLAWWQSGDVVRRADDAGGGARVEHVDGMNQPKAA